MKGALLVLLQLAAVVGLLVTGPWIAWRWWWLELSGGIVSVWAVWTMGLRRLRIGPVPPAEARLLTHGPYRWIRHPMYSGLLLAAAAVLLERFTWQRALFWLALLAALVAKLRYEECYLKARFPEYEEYRRRTKGLLPFVVGLLLAVARKSVEL